MENIEDKVDALTKAVNDLTLEVKTFIAEQKQICLSHRAETDKLQKITIDGNGTPSLQSQVQDLQASMGVIKWIVIIMAPAIIALLGNSLWHYFKTAPP